MKNQFPILGYGMFYLGTYLHPVFHPVRDKDSNAKSDENVWICGINFLNIVERFMETLFKLFCGSILCNFL